MNENNQQYFIKRIGRTNFKVKVFFSETEKETLEDKILRLHRTIIAVQMRSQIFRQTKPKAEVILCVLPSILAKYGGKYASRCAAKVSAVNCAVQPLELFAEKHLKTARKMV